MPTFAADVIESLPVSRQYAVGSWQEPQPARGGRWSPAYCLLRTAYCFSERVDARPAQHQKKRSKRQSDYVRVAAVDRFDEHGADALHGVGARFVERLAGANVPLDLLGGERQHAHFGLRDAGFPIVALRVF